MSLKDYYKKNINRNDFLKLVSFNLFIELVYESAITIVIYLNNFVKGKRTGITFIDSTSIKDEIK